LSQKSKKDFYTETPNGQQKILWNFQQTHQQKSLQIGDIAWKYYDSETDGPVLLLLHGGFADFSMWIHQIMFFEKEYRIIAPTCPALPKATMEAYSEGLQRILDAENVNRFNIMGYSEGGLIAQVFLRKNLTRVDKVILGHTFYPTPDNKYYQYNFNLFRVLPAPLTVWIFKNLAQPDKEERLANTDWSTWFQGYFKELKSKLTKDLILTHIDLMIDFVRNYKFQPDDFKAWDGRMLITVSEDDVVFKYFDGLKRLYPMAQTHNFDADLGAHSIALISPGIFNQRVDQFLDGSTV
jgi:pimeloyl-ACP methyl ester carboxylesterase